MLCIIKMNTIAHLQSQLLYHSSAIYILGYGLTYERKMLLSSWTLMNILPLFQEEGTGDRSDNTVVR